MEELDVSHVLSEIVFWKISGAVWLLCLRQLVIIFWGLIVAEPKLLMSR